jgi:hypothetical protein
MSEQLKKTNVSSNEGTNRFTSARNMANLARARNVLKKGVKSGDKTSDSCTIENLSNSEKFAYNGFLQYPELQSLIDVVKLEIPQNEFFHEHPMYHIPNRFWINNDGYIMYMTKYHENTKIGASFRIVEIIKNMDTGHYSAVIEAWAAGVGIRNFEVSTSISSREFVRTMDENGFIVIDSKREYERFKKMLSDAFQKKTPEKIPVYTLSGDLSPQMWDAIIGNAPIFKIVHSRTIGWEKNPQNDNLIFKGSEIYDSEKTYSQYVGEYDISAKGSWNIYKDMLEAEVIGNTRLETILAIGASATMLQYLNLRFSLDLLNPLVHIYGDTTMGKTAASMLLVSIGGNPNLNNSSQKTLFQELNATANSLMKTLGDNHGFPICFDELGMSEMTSKERERVLMSLAGGRDKARLERDGKRLQESTQYHTVILLNGEEPILSNNNVKHGLLMRVFEFPAITWTDGAENSENIERMVSENYGFVTPMLAKHLLKLNNEENEKLLKNYKDWIERIVREANEKMLSNKFTKRIAKTLALFIISAECFNKATSLNLDIEKIYRFVFDTILNEKSDESRLGERAYRFLLDYYNNHQSKFRSKWKSPDISNGEYMGTLLSHRSYEKSVTVKTATTGEFKTIQMIAFTQGQAEELFEKIGGFASVKTILYAFWDMGLICSKNPSIHHSLTASPFQFGKMSVTNGYKIYIPESSEFEEFEDY